MAMHSLWESVIEQKPPIDSAVDFPTPSRFHIALNVKDVEPLMPFYAAVFGKAPTLVRDGYAKFEVDEPPLNLSLNRVAHNARGSGSFGIGTRNDMLVEQIRARAQNHGIAVRTLEQSSGPGAFVVEDAERNSWRIFTT
ncbi:MAG: VOC family protein [Aquisalimonadaceae bacterium]